MVFDNRLPTADGNTSSITNNYTCYRTNPFYCTIIRILTACIAVISFLLVPSSSHAQNASGSVPDVRRIILEGRSIHSTVSVPFLGNTLINIHELGDRYFFTPNPIADWSKFNGEVIDECIKEQGADILRIPLDILMFEEETLETLSRESNISRTKLSPAPSYGYSIFYRIGNNPAVILETTVSIGNILRGESLSAETDLPRNVTVLVEGTCPQLKEIGKYAKLVVSLHVVGKTFTTSSFNAAVTLRQALQFKLKAAQDEEEIDVVTINSSSSSSGLGISLGQISFGNSSGNSSVERSSKRYRVIDTEWMQEVVNEATTDINIEEICDQADCPTDVNRALLDFLKEYTKESIARVNLQADQSLLLTIDGIPGSKKVSVSEEMKAKLNTLWERATTQEAEIDGVKVKKTDNDKMQVDGDTEWTRNGDQWIPTSFKALMLNESDISNQITINYSRTIMAASEAVSILAGQQHPFSREPYRSVSIPTLFERVADPKKWPLRCKEFSSTSSFAELIGFEPFLGLFDMTANSTSASVMIPSDYYMTGGYCSFRAIISDSNGYPNFISSTFTNSNGLEEWSCTFDEVSESAVGFRAIATAIGCRLEY